MEDSAEVVPVQKKWVKLGVALAFLHYVFLLLIVILLQIDLYLAVAVAVIVSLVGGVAFMIFVLYIY